ncbi:ABC transporter permease [Aphanothece hegewaldii CCALA 016]|uniref:ABC transporter permease n=1 Tax=Aphanothece hegewaldii CCALA 016 TaxID=2107694 RepID=A0A2T1M3S8_9CHRO|nr:ABC transporter permease [Aphanothece hegewaldii]PSF39472.1 ABC transporter permease [Aphanothece hegewaldii CCALA 016]
MDIKEHFKMAFSAIMSNKLRSILTMLGITVGNASVIAMVGIGEGTQRLTAEQFATLGPNVLFVSLTSRNIRSAIPNARPLVLSDAEAIEKQIPNIVAVSPELFGQFMLTNGQKNAITSIVGTSPEYLQVRNFQIKKGRFLNANDLRRNNRVVVLGSQVAQDLFEKQDPIGEQIRIKNISFEVIGVMRSKGALFGTNQDNQVLVPLTTMAHQLQGKTSIYGVRLHLLAVLVKDKSQLEAAQFQIKNFIRLRHQVNFDDYVKVVPQQTVMDLATQTNEGLTRMLAAIASISLFVGGIGVMNIMLVSVTERTQEIGLRKALGAKEKDILLQFLIEAVILAITGGAIGTFVGVGGMVFAQTFSMMYTSVSVPAIIATLGVSGGIGLIFGVIPARRAASLDPVDALRRS